MIERNRVTRVLGVTRITAGFHQLFNRNRLTVLAYHRIIELSDPNFRGFAPNVSASPAMFESHMAYVKNNFNVISLDDLVAWINGKKTLPSYPLLITFDDGYLDNYQNAFPVLKKYGFPAIIFLMTSRMDEPNRWTWWDECSYYFEKTTKQSATLPIMGKVDSVGEQTRNIFMKDIKAYPESEKSAILGQLPDILDVPPPPLDKPFFMTWEQINELVSHGVACQPHTVNHPIMTRISLEEAHQELEQSRDIIREKTGQNITAFAYPNGKLSDYSPDIMQILRKLDYQTAFTLSTGPVPLQEASDNPLEIARVYITHMDSLDTFKLKTTPLPYWADGIQYLGEKK